MNASIRAYASIIGAIVLIQAVDDEAVVSEIFGQMHVPFGDISG